MTDLMLPAAALKIELFGVPQDLNTAVVSLASYVPPAVVATTAKASSTMIILAPGKIKKRKALSAGAKRWHFLSTLLMLDKLLHS